MRVGHVALLSVAVSSVLTLPASAASCPGTPGASRPDAAGCDGSAAAAPGTPTAASGGGGGVTGGAGGTSSDGTQAQGGQSAGAGGDSASAPMAADTNGGGGGGGAHGYFGTDVPTGVSVTGGTGGAGGSAGGLSGSAGGYGGGGGFGAVITGAGGTLSVDVTGGTGGAGGSGNTGGKAGYGGSGGMGFVAVDSTTLTINSAVRGGSGGAGGNQAAATGGGGGAGGQGLHLMSGGSVTVNGSVAGGDGGTGGTGSVQGELGGPGGGGIMVATGGAVITVNNGASVRGGNAGAAAMGSPPGIPSGGGIGIAGGDLTVINSGTISSGLNRDGSYDEAILFSFGTNVLELRSGAVVNGTVRNWLGTSTLRLGGDGAADSFDASKLSSTTGGSEQYQGFSHFEKTGNSTWTVTGTSAYSGDITVNGGRLNVTGALASVSLTTVEVGALSGVGTLGAVQVNSGAVLMPGDGTANSYLTVSSLAMQTGSFYAVALDPSTSSKTLVTGSATLGGATVVTSFAPGSYIEKRYNILTAGNALTDTFNATVTNTNLPSRFKTSLSYDTNNAYLDLTLDLTAPSGPTNTGLPTNQSNVGNAITNFFNSTGSIPMAFGALTPQGLTQVSGEVGTSGQNTTFQANTQFMNVIGDVTSAGRGGVGAGVGGGAMGYADEAMAYAGKSRSKKARDAFAAIDKTPPKAPSFEQRWSVWAMGFGGSQTTDGNATQGTNTASSSIYGVAVGVDYRFGPDTVAGFALAGGGTSYSIVDGGTGRSDLFQAGAFVRQNFGATYLTASAAYGWQDVTTDRYVTVAGVDHLRAEFNTNSYSGRVELGHRYLAPAFGGLGLTPYAAAEVTAFVLPSYAEREVSGASMFALNYDGDTSVATRSELGLRTDKSYALEGAMLTLRGRAAWAHNFNPDSAVTATFQSLPGASFLVNGAKLAPDSALTTASAELSWMNGWSIAGTFEGEFSDVTRSYGGKGVVRYNW